MTTGQIMMKLREIEEELDGIDDFCWSLKDRRSTEHLATAKTELCNLIEQMLADEQQAREAHTMGDLPFDGQKGKP